MTGDFSQICQRLHRSDYNLVASWLTVLHFADRLQLFKQCYEVRPAGSAVAGQGYRVCPTLLASRCYDRGASSLRRILWAWRR
jgi:hypothetical protein